jgi:hypothetical protein
MLRAALRTSLVVVAMLALRSEAAITLEVRVDSQVRDDVAVHVAVRNVGDEPAEQAWPEARLAGATARGDPPASLPPAYTASWDLTLPRPRELGTLPLVVELHYADAFGVRRSAPAVHQVRTAATPALDVAFALEVAPLVATGTATVRLENRETTAIAGTLHALTTDDLSVAPAERAIELAAHGTLAVPLTLESRGASPDSTGALWAWVTIPRGTHVDSLTAHAAVPVVSAAAETPGAAGAAVPLAIIASLGLALWGARRLVARPRAGASRAERRRGR